MNVIVMRHGDATFLGAQRVLTERGRQEVQITALKLAGAMKITKIMSSPKQRALQTASIVQSLLRGAKIPQIEVLPELSPTGDAEMVYEYLNASCAPDDTVLLVSHIPQVCNLSCTLCHRELDIPRFHTASALILQRPAANSLAPDMSATAPYGYFQAVKFFTPSSELNLVQPMINPHQAAVSAAMASSLVGTAAAQPHFATNLAGQAGLSLSL